MTTEPATVAPAASSPSSDGLQRIEQKLDALNTRMANVEQQTAPKVEATNKHASKGAVAAAFAVAGFKVGAFFGGKTGFLIDHLRAFRRGGLDAIPELWMTLFTLGRNKEAKEIKEVFTTVKYTVMGMGVGSTVGPVIAGIVGYTRGDRLEKASDLFVHPIDSMNKLFGPDPRATTHAAIPVTMVVAPATGAHEGTLAHAPEKTLSN